MTQASPPPILDPAKLGRGGIFALIRAMRPKQWTKNVLVAAVPLAAGQLFNLTVLWQTFGAFAVFCLAASATYLVNDSCDVRADQSHPTKCYRPIAAGQITVRLARVVALGLFLVALGLAVLISTALAGILAVYIAVTLSYSLFLKHEPVIELVLLSLGFLLRAIAGGAATGIPISSWFLIVAAFGSLFMAAGKRASELNTVEMSHNISTGSTRRVLAGYSSSYLRFVWGMAAAVTVTGYCLWAFEIAETTSALPWAKLSIIFFVLAIMLYAVQIDQGKAGAPDEVVLADRKLMVTGALWVLVFSAAALGL